MKPLRPIGKRRMRVSLILGSLAILLVIGYQNADEFDPKELEIPRHLASIHESQSREDSRQKSPELYLQKMWEQAPIAGQLGQQLRDEESKSECDMSDPHKCSETLRDSKKDEGLGLGMDPLRQSASVRIGSGFETNMSSIGGTSPTFGIRKEFSPNSCINLEMNQSTNQGRLTFDLKF